MNSVVMRPAAVCSPNSSSCVTSCRSSGSISWRISSDCFFGELAEQVGGGVGIHFLDDVGGAILVERFDDRHLDVGIDLLERLGGHFLVDRLEDRLALGRRQILDDVGDVGRMQLRQPLVGDLQLDAPRRVGLEQVDELPRDDARRNPLEQRAQRERRHDALRQPADGAARADVDGDDADRSRWLLTGVDSSSTSLTRTTLRPWMSMICWSSRSRLSSSRPSDGVKRSHCAASLAARTVAPADVIASARQHALAARRS